MQFLVRYFDPQRSAVVETTAEADSEASVRAEWSSQGRVILSLRQQTRVVARGAVGAGEFRVAWWCRELRTLLQAGMTVVEALETLHAQSLGTHRQGLHEGLVKSLREGQPLSRAMQSSGRFPAVLVASVKASERTSTLVEALDDYLRYDAMLEKLRKQAVSAAIYPAVVVALGAVIAVFLLLYVIPRFSRMYTDFHGTVSTATAMMLWLSTVLREYSAVLLAAVAAVAALLAWAWRSGTLRRWAEQLADRIELLQRRLDEFRFAKLYQSLALMFKGGYTLDEALSVCASLGLGRRVSAGIDIARGELAQGRAVSTAFINARLTDPVTQRLIAVGERTGNFDRVLQTIADRHAETFATFVERATRIVEPVLLLLVALVVGGIVVLMYMPIFDIANGLQ